MAKVTAPLLSFDARGQIGSSQVYAGWRGIQYSRRYVIPANPRTAAQIETRSVFTWLNEVWKLMASGVQAPWSAFVVGKPLINRNAFISKNLPVLRTPIVNTAFIASPGANGGVAMPDMTVAGAVGNVTATPDLPDLPTGWTITAFTAIAIISADPHTSTDYNSVSDVVNAAPWTANMAVAAGDYVVSGFLTFTTAAGKTAYSPSITKTATAT